MKLEHKRLHYRIQQEEDLLNNLRATPKVNKSSSAIRTRNPLERIEDKLLREGQNRNKKLQNIRMKEESERALKTQYLGKTEKQQRVWYKPPKPKKQI